MPKDLRTYYWYISLQYLTVTNTYDKNVDVPNNEYFEVKRNYDLNMPSTYCNISGAAPK